MNKILTKLAIIFALAAIPLVNSTQPFYPIPHSLNHFASHPHQAQPALNALNKLPEFQELLTKVQREGPVHLSMQPGLSFEGLWDANSRTIVVNTGHERPLGSIICTILFELHNAATTRYYDQLIDQAQKGLLTKDQYVEKVEMAEYQNAMNTKTLLEKGIKMGVFPESASWPVMPNFEDHYKVQQVSGHSLFIADSYDMIYPKGKTTKYTGTIFRPTWMNAQDKDELCRYIAMGAGLKSADQEAAERYLSDLKEEIAFLKKGYNKIGERHHIERNPRRVELIKIALKENKKFIQETKDVPFLAMS